MTELSNDPNAHQVAKSMRNSMLIESRGKNFALSSINNSVAHETEAQKSQTSLQEEGLISPILKNRQLRNFKADWKS